MYGSLPLFVVLVKVPVISQHNLRTVHWDTVIHNDKYANIRQ